MAVADRIRSLFSSIALLFRGRRIGISKKDVVQIGEHILIREYAHDEIVLFDSENRGVYLLNRTAAALIRLVDGVRTLEWIARNIAWDFDEKTNVVVRDSKKICRELLKKGVLTMAPDRSFITKIKREIVVREEDDGAFIFDPITDGLSAVNETGLLILRQIDGKKTLADITNAVAAEFSDVEPNEVARDVESFIEGLISRKMIDG